MVKSIPLIFIIQSILVWYFRKNLDTLYKFASKWYDTYTVIIINVSHKTLHRLVGYIMNRMTRSHNLNAGQRVFSCRPMLGKLLKNSLKWWCIQFKKKNKRTHYAEASIYLLIHFSQLLRSINQSSCSFSWAYESLCALILFPFTLAGVLN